jgi:hypothetical protein
MMPVSIVLRACSILVPPEAACEARQLFVDRFLESSARVAGPRGHFDLKHEPRISDCC